MPVNIKGVGTSSTPTSVLESDALLCAALLAPLTLSDVGLPPKPVMSPSRTETVL
jgi:hypothetical protein